jgi:hypothetical protein
MATVVNVLREMQKIRDADAYAEQLIKELRKAKPEVIKMTPQLLGI